MPGNTFRPPPRDMIGDCIVKRERLPCDRQASSYRAARSIERCPEHRALPVQHEARQVTIRLLGCAGPVVLPQFYFPGWVGPDGLPPPVADPKTGLMLITVPAG